MEVQGVKLSEEELAEYGEVFAYFDTDGSGSINTTELGPALRSLGFTPTEAEVEKMVDELDENADGELDFGEFLNVMVRVRATDPLEELMDAFKVFDRDGDGTIHVKELYHIMTKMGDRITDSEMQEWLYDTEIEEGGQIEIEKFIDDKFGFLKKS
mmetsp:Transcript_24218/g.38726  ORF Transcript_24218/g.38726 Transcript_24218/m.38726 type:complete len:156 (+) Transcript_24218:67-534(+)